MYFLVNVKVPRNCSSDKKSSLSDLRLLLSGWGDYSIFIGK